MNTSIIIPNWNGKKLLEKHLPSVLKSFENKVNKIVEIIIVDDGSTDNSVEYIENNFKNVKMIRNFKNLGFSKACNKGVSNAKGDLVVLLNTDVSVESNFLKNVYKIFDDERVFAVSFHEKGYGPATAKFDSGFLIHSNLGDKTNSEVSFWASGGSAIFRKSHWTILHGFDEKVLSPFYWEDVDISYRAQKRGLIVKWDRSANVKHEHESVINSSNFKLSYLNTIKERNYLLFHWKNLTSNEMLKNHIFNLLRRTVIHPGYIKVVFFAMIKIFAVMDSRKREKVEAIVSDEDIFSNYIKE